MNTFSLYYIKKHTSEQHTGVKNLSFNRFTQKKVSLLQAQEKLHWSK